MTQKIIHSDRAVSPVIGVILMVAITVILAAVIGAFVLDISPSEDPAPSAQFGFDINESDHVIVTHEGGDRVTSDLELRYGDETDVWDGPIGVGDDITTNSSVPSGETVRVVYVSGDGSTESVLSRFDMT